MNETLYQKVLHATLPPARSPDCPRPLKYRWYFIQDNARPHSTVRSMEVLSELTRNRMYDHPANSPDLNIIEDMWSYLDRKVRESKITTIQGLKRKLTMLWSELPWEYVRKSVNSMPRRLMQCIERDGGRTDY